MPQDTSLHKAANQGDVEACREILDSGEVDINAPGAAERTALQRAVGGNHMELAKLLIERGADVNKKDKAGRTSLHWAAIGGHHEPVQLLLENGVDINAKTSSGMTALHGIVEGNRLECANVLIGHHEKVVAGEIQGTPLDFDAVDGEGKTAMAIAKEKKFPELFKMCKEKRLLKPGENANGACVIC
ncbi:Ankyrin repeat domain-containing protein 1 [Hondaea fermentalgiana]|uniref:Ankyrin repeat domain-containing protein 1 n=1 Tax=Hondaea fermentalgiana TaxID=2315210 RepID=A0A2R5GY75_9STRA|nr:Ankyrin repeat domain-containing protein 1 [Hondaea fermentalgiana]|eukprot:GBG33401.1 Ankyrin repeat domain-containing protein 1 [Hondaea fermentalgiana]